MLTSCLKVKAYAVACS